MSFDVDALARGAFDNIGALMKRFLLGPLSVRHQGGEMMTTEERRSYWQRNLARRRLLQVSAMSAGAVAVTAACGGSSNSASSSTTPAGSPAAAGTPRKGGRLRVGANVDLIWTNAPYQLNTPYVLTQFAIYDTLFRYNSVTTLKPVPRLAESYSFNGDQSELTVTLRPNLKFHSGKALDAQAVIDSFNSLADPATPPNQPSGLAKAYVASTQAVDATHIKFTLKRPGMLIFDLFNFWLVADAANIAQLKSGGLPNGSGPFKVTSATPKIGGKLDAFSDFWEPPLLDGIDYKVYPDPSSLAVAVQSGAVDLTKDLTIDDALRLGKDSKFQIVHDKGLTADFSFGMNTKGDVTKDPRVRQALYHLVDRKNVVDTVFLGQATQVNSLWPKGSPAYESRYDADPLNVQTAKGLLAQAGYQNGTPPIEIIIPSRLAAGQQIGQLIQADAKKAGVNLTLKVLEESVYNPELLKGAFPGAYFNGFGFNTMHPDSLTVMNNQMRVPGATNYNSPAYDTLQADLAAAKTDAERKALYQTFNQLWDKDMWVFLICSQTFEWIMTKGVTGFTTNDYAVPLVEKVSLA